MDYENKAENNCFRICFCVCAYVRTLLWISLLRLLCYLMSLVMMTRLYKYY